MKINEETTVSEEQVLFNKLRYEEQQFILKQMKLLQPCELNCEVEEEKKIPEKLDVLIEIKSKDKIGALTNEISEIQRKFNQLLDYFKSKGDE